MPKRPFEYSIPDLFLCHVTGGRASVAPTEQPIAVDKTHIVGDFIGASLLVRAETLQKNEYSNGLLGKVV